MSLRKMGCRPINALFIQPPTQQSHGIFGMTLGRLGANGMPQLYMTDWHGTLVTLTPTP